MKTDNIYPLTIIADRYNGTYSKCKFTAWNCDPDWIPKQVFGSDVSCSRFWSTYNKPVGKGDTPEAAIRDLKNQLDDKIYIDLELPSGTLWAESNEESFYNFTEAIDKFKNKVPTPKQFQELCSLFHRWDNERKGIEFLGNNGNKLFLPAVGCGNEDMINDLDTDGYYWSSSAYNNDYAYYLRFDDSGYINPKINSDSNCKFSVRLIK